MTAAKSATARVVGVHVAVLRTAEPMVDVVVERAGLTWSGVHARRAHLTPDEAERLGRALLEAAAAARAEAGS